MSVLTENEKDKLLNLCAKKWIEYCGVSSGHRTLYWDIAFSVVVDCKIFEEYIKKFPYGKESLKYNVSDCSKQCYENVKNEEIKYLTQNDKDVFLKGYELFISTLN